MKSYKNVLSGTFYAPTFNNVFSLVITAFESKKDLLRQSEDIAGELIMLHYPDYCNYEYSWDKGKMNLRRLIEVCKEVSAFMKIKDIFSNPEFYGITKFIATTHIDNKESDIIGFATLTEQYKSFDNDPYETAGGYRQYLADVETKVTFGIDPMNKLYASIPSSLIVDHYNNNFYGVSTGNGTKKYAMGEHVVKRNLTIGYDVKQVLEKLPLKDIMFDFDKAKNIAKSNIDKQKKQNNYLEYPAV